MALTQMQIIQSLGEVMSWLERDLSPTVVAKWIDVSLRPRKPLYKRLWRQ